MVERGESLLEVALAMSTSPTTPPAAAPIEAFLEHARVIVGVDHVSTDPDTLGVYGRDWTKVFEPRAAAVVFPRSTEEVSRLVRAAFERGIAIVPSGGRTGLAGGAVAASGEVVLSLERMRAMGAVDPRALTVEVEAGAVTAALHAHVEEAGLVWPIDLASKGSSTIGGNVATNAGGVKVIRYGLTRHWVLGLEVVTGRGEVLALNGALEKNNTGVDLRQLFIGSEGTLGIITRVTLKLAPAPGPLDVLLFAVEGLAGVLRLFGEARAAPFTLSAFEMFTDRCYERLRRHRGLALPIGARSSHYVLVEVESATREVLEGWLEHVLEGGIALDATLAENVARARAIWELREGISESLAATGLPHKNDIALPIAELEPFTQALEALVEREWPGFELCIFGHIGDGNLHVNVMKPEGLSKEEFLEHAHAADARMFELVRAHRGSVSAEHGIGLLKRDALPFSRTAEEIAISRGIKAVLDPAAILNPGKIV